MSAYCANSTFFEIANTLSLGMFILTVITGVLRNISRGHPMKVAHIPSKSPDVTGYLPFFAHFTSILNKSPGFDV